MFEYYQNQGNNLITLFQLTLKKASQSSIKEHNNRYIIKIFKQTHFESIYSYHSQVTPYFLKYCKKEINTFNINK